MWQRIQTIFLALIILLQVLTLFLPSWQKTVTNSKTNSQYIFQMDAFNITQYEREDGKKGKIVKQESVLSIAIIAIVGAAISLFILLQFKNRMRQVKLSSVNTLFIGGTAAAMIFYSRNAEQWMEPSVSGSWQYAIYLPMAALILNMLARHFIMRDERMVRSADRLR